MDPGHFGEIWLNGPGAECSVWRSIFKWPFNINISLDYASFFFLNEMKKPRGAEVIYAPPAVMPPALGCCCMQRRWLGGVSSSPGCAKCLQTRQTPEPRHSQQLMIAAWLGRSGGSRGKWDDIQPVWIHGSTFKRTSVTLALGAAAGCVRFV